jgi:hypothetical protein
MCDASGTAVFCRESIEFFPGIVSRFFSPLLLLLFLISIIINFNIF